MENGGGVMKTEQISVNFNVGRKVGVSNTND